MPEMQFAVRWPDDAISIYYSPSLVVREYLQPGTDYGLSDFVERSRIALTIASERVREKYGFPCSRAAYALEQIEAKAAEFRALPDAAVRIEAYHDGQ